MNQALPKRQRKRKPIERKLKLLEKWAEADTADTAEADTGPRLTSGLAKWVEEPD